MSYRRNPSWDWEDVAAEGLAGLAVVAAIIVAAVVATLLIVLAKEVARVYMARAFQPTAAARVLWIAGAVFMAILLLCGLLAANPFQAPLAAYVSAWSFLAFVVVIEGCDWYESRFDQEQLNTVDNDQLDAYLTEPFVPATNGKVPIGAGMK